MSADEMMVRQTLEEKLRAVRETIRYTGALYIDMIDGPPVRIKGVWIFAPMLDAALKDDTNQPQIWRDPTLIGHDS